MQGVIFVDKGCIFKIGPQPMAARNTETERLIKETAKKIFLVEGRIHATTEDIAQEAGIPRTSVHYYFRTRDLLFKHVFNEALSDLTARLNSVIESDLPFREKLENYIDICLSDASAHPYVETFVVTEIINQKFELVDKESPVRLKAFLKEIKTEMTKGVIPEMNPFQFILNLFALLTYPAIAAPLYKKLFEIESQPYQKLLKERKQVILKVLLR